MRHASLREPYLQTLRRKTDRPIPYFFSLCGSLAKKFKEQHGNVDYREYYDIPLREVFLRPTRLDLAKVYENYVSPGEKDPITEWGIVLRPGGGDSHFTRMEGPLENRRCLRDVLSLPLPDFLDDYRWEGVPETIAALKADGKIVFPGIYGGHDSGCQAGDTPAFMDIFESSWYLCGLDNFLIGLAEEEEYALALLDKVGGLKTELARRWTRAGVDILITADDVGTQTGLMMSATMWRTHLKPRLKILYDAIRARGLNLAIHSCGDIAEFFPDIIELGVEVVHPIQPEAMDVAMLQREYGKDIVMYGGIGTQSTLIYGTPEDVVAQARTNLEIFSSGGYILGPAGAISTDTKIENVVALTDFAMSL